MSKKIDLYIIHGWTYTIKPWDKTLEILKKNDINVHMLKVPGLTEESEKVFTINDYVRWANQNIPDGAIALGHSNGGRILLNLCAKKPKKLKTLNKVKNLKKLKALKKVKKLKKLKALKRRKKRKNRNIWQICLKVMTAASSISMRYWLNTELTA